MDARLHKPRANQAKRLIESWARRIRKITDGDRQGMHFDPLGRTGWEVSEVSFGAWAIGGAWGQVSDEESMAALHQAIDCGINFIDTADVYGNGRSERLIAKLKKARGGKAEIIVATKAGRRLPRQTIEGYSRQNLMAWIEDSLRNLSASGPGPTALPANCTLRSA